MQALWLLVMKFGPILWQAVGTAILAAFTQLLAGRTLKRLILWPIEAVSKLTKNTKDDELAKDARIDLGLDSEK